MLRIGLTGGIGSGKTTVAKVFETFGVPVYYADERAKQIMNEDETLKQSIQEHFGKEAYVKGVLNRGYLSNIVFNSQSKLALLNSLVHPATIKDADKWMLQQSGPYAIKEAALIFESGAQEHLDHVIGVYAPTSVRIQRVMNRDSITREEVQLRMNKQIQEEMKMRLSDFVITNDDRQLLIPQVVALHDKLVAMAW